MYVYCALSYDVEGTFSVVLRGRHSPTKSSDLCAASFSANTQMVIQFDWHGTHARTTAINIAFSTFGFRMPVSTATATGPTLVSAAGHRRCLAPGKVQLQLHTFLQLSAPAVARHSNVVFLSLSPADKRVQTSCVCTVSLHSLDLIGPQ